GKRKLLYPSGRVGRITVRHITRRFSEYRVTLGLEEVLPPHCLRHSYIIHLIEDVADQSFVQRQVGHAWGSTTAIYTHAGSDFMNNALREVLDTGLGGQ